MKPIELGQCLSFRIETQYRDTAEAFGNANVRVVGTPALVGFLETAADRCLMPCYEAKEGSVGTSIELAHLAAAPEGSIVDASAEVIGVDGRRVRFAVEARRGEVVLIKGHHERAVVDLERFLAKVAAQR